MIETAYAKLNLALHVRRRRTDGYHELETLFAFVDAGDGLSAQPAAQDELRTVGEFAQLLTDPFDNIVGRALRTLPHGPGWAADRPMRARCSAWSKRSTACPLIGTPARLN